MALSQVKEIALPTVSPHGSVDSGNVQSQRHVLKEEDIDGYRVLGYSFKNWKKWTILSGIAWCQISMNYNAAIYSNGIKVCAK
jgi:hypothetical protein